uniref:HSF_DOMAIN domain-containing protein n=1 Tax=Caenorhabditis tropicalis TaxID=1561998 RepID=A0A1I7TLQ4_9PELO
MSSQQDSTVPRVDMDPHFKGVNPLTGCFKCGCSPNTRFWWSPEHDFILISHLENEIQIKGFAEKFNVDDIYNQLSQKIDEYSWPCAYQKGRLLKFSTSTVLVHSVPDADCTNSKQFFLLKLLEENRIHSAAQQENDSDHMMPLQPPTATHQLPEFPNQLGFVQAAPAVNETNQPIQPTATPNSLQYLANRRDINFDVNNGLVDSVQPPTAGLPNNTPSSSNQELEWPNATEHPLEDN